MPIQLNYTDPNTGITASASYWYVVVFHVDRTSTVGSPAILATFGGYKDAASRSAGKVPAFPVYSIQSTLSAIGVVGSTTVAALVGLIETFALTYVDPSTGQIFFSGGTIV